jgi:hypothetical protein
MHSFEDAIAEARAEKAAAIERGDMEAAVRAEWEIDLLDLVGQVEIAAKRAKQSVWN